MRIVSWNVNGIRAAVQKGLHEKIPALHADIIGLQEIRAQEAQIMPLIDFFQGYHLYFSTGMKPGYSGVALFSKNKPNDVISELGEKFDAEGRFQAAFFDDFCLVNAYFPNGSGKDGDNSRVPYKLEFYDAVKDFLSRYSMPKIIIGDFNTAHQEIDLARPKANQNKSGFLLEEREHFTHFMGDEFIDTFRMRNHDAGHYTWWSNRANARENNVGWRIDYVLACPQINNKVKDAFIWPDISGSDHCPVGIDLDLT
ncbi:MAG: exodeoxyribonuclease III [Myxococcales bacterium]|nr:exodeoxyribonuclease III [Myxococcales bacterium]USN51185.1 MAG: exodeoxyribonuclease III [Myxococcales bacterium]